MNLKEWAALQGVSYVTARRWFVSGKLPVSAEQVDGASDCVGDRRGADARPRGDLEVDDVARDMTEILTSLCGRHATANRAARAVEAITGNVP